MAELTETGENPQAEAKPISVYDVIMVMVDNMASLAWQKLGLQADLVTGKVEKNLEEAKMAIDLTTHLASFIEPRLDDEDRRRMHSLVRDLRINYVEKSKES